MDACTAAATTTNPPTEPARRGPKVLLLAGEASGDLQGANLARSLRQIEPEMDLVAVGGPRMRSAGVRVVMDSSSWGVIGIWDALWRMPHIYSVFVRAKALVRSERPDLVVLIDCPGVNMQMARFLRREGIPTVYYFPPSAWSPRTRRARQIAETVDHVVATFSFTAETYERGGQPVAYFGHPMADLPEPSETPAEVQARLGLPEGRRFVGILPGSRPPEIRRLSPALLGAARLLNERVPGLHFLLPVAFPALQPLVRQEVARHGSDLSLTVLDGHGGDVMHASELLLMSSGSASLEAALFGTPMVLVYRLPAADFLIGQFVVEDFTYMGLPNLILQRYVVPELLQDEVTAERVAAEALPLLQDAARRREIEDNLRKVKKELGAPGVCGRVARYIWETALHGPGRGHHHQ